MTGFQAGVRVLLRDTRTEATVVDVFKGSPWVGGRRVPDRIWVVIEEDAGRRHLVRPNEIAINEEDDDE